MTVSSSDYTTVVTDCRNALAKGISLTGPQMRLVIDVVEHAANTLDSKGAATSATVNSDADALEAELVTQMAAWDAAGAGDSSAVYTAALAALAPLRTALIASANAVAAAAAASITNVTASDQLDGRSA